jgi:formate-dependent nitrite reductase membrane component NrfD
MPWPQPPPGHELEPEFLKLGFQAEIDSELSTSKAIHDARVEVAKATIERGRAGAEFVRNAAAAIVTLYTGVLGVAFAATENGTPLPARGLVPAVFLGLALASASAYAALLASVPAPNAPIPHADLEIFQERRLDAFIRWVTRIALGRVYFLHASVLMLGMGVLFLPAAFLDIASWLVFGTGAVALLVALLLPLVTTRQ